MARETRITCDCCGKVLDRWSEPFIKVPRYVVSKYGIEGYGDKLFICARCLREIGERVAERYRPVDIEYEVTE